MQMGDPMELNFEVLEVQKWNLSTDRTQTVYKKNGIICLHIMFTPRVMVITMPKMAQKTVWAKYLSASDGSYVALL